jgi:hypothetical protein
MKLLEEIKADYREPIYSNWKENEILRPVVLGFYLIMVTIIGVFGIVLSL